MGIVAGWGLVWGGVGGREGHVISFIEVRVHSKHRLPGCWKENGFEEWLSVGRE